MHFYGGNFLEKGIKFGQISNLHLALNDYLLCPDRARKSPSLRDVDVRLTPNLFFPFPM